VTILTDLAKFGFVLALLLIFLWISGFGVGITYLALPLLIISQLMLITALAWFVAALVPFLPDLKILVDHILQITFFLSGIFFAGSSIPEQYQFYFYLNPMANLIEGYRDILMHNQWPDWSALFLTGLPVTGSLYNIVGKLTRWKFLFIAYAHTTVFAVPYFAIAGAADTAFLVGCLYLFSWVVFQIAVSGEVKDMAQDEANFLKALGSTVEPSGDGHLVTFSPAAKLFSYASRAVTVALGVGFAHLVARRYDTAGSALAGLGITELMLVGVGALSLALTWSMLQNGPFNRTERIATMSKIEATSVLILLVAVVPVIGMPAAVFLFLGSGVWVMVFNKIEWGTLVAPDV
jgi:hypothetical protein